MTGIKKNVEEMAKDILPATQEIGAFLDTLYDKYDPTTIMAASFEASMIIASVMVPDEAWGNFVEMLHRTLTQRQAALRVTSMKVLRDRGLIKPTRETSR